MNRRDVELAQQRRLVASLGPNDGYLNWQSSPHILWLASLLHFRGLANG